MNTLLIADDSQAKIDLICSMLVHCGWNTEPRIAMTTEEAMRIIDEEQITHAFIDFYIPTQNGPTIIAKLKESNPTARIALVSSSDKASNFDEARAAGAEACICTTYASDQVEAAFKDLLADWSV